MKQQPRTALPSILLCLALVLLSALPPATAAAAPAPVAPKAAGSTAPISITADAPRAAVASAAEWRAVFARRFVRQPAPPEVIPPAQRGPSAAIEPPFPDAAGAQRPVVLRPERGGTVGAAGGAVTVRFDGLPGPMLATLTQIESADLPSNFALLGPIVTVRGRWLDPAQAGRIEAEGSAEGLVLEEAPAVSRLDPEATPRPRVEGGKPLAVPSRFWATVVIDLPSREAAAPDVAIARLAPDGQKWELLPTEFAGGKAVAKTDRLGNFALVKNMALLAPYAPAAGEIIVDDLDPGFQRFTRGEERSGWTPVACGASCWAGHMYYMYNRSSYEDLPLNLPWDWATWTPAITDPGFYKVEVFVPGINATTSGANYQVYHAGQVDSVVVNQLTTSAAWKNIGAFEFNAAGGEYVYLDDVVPETARGASLVGFDAIRFTFCPDPAACQPDLEPPVIHSVYKWLDGVTNRGLIRATVTDNVAVAEVVAIFNGQSINMQPAGGDLWEAIVNVPPNQISGLQVVATDPSGNTAVWPTGTLINIRGYLSRGLGGGNLICLQKNSCDPGTSGSGGDPVNTAYGNFFYPLPLLTVPGPGDSDIVIELSYNSLAGEPVGTIEYTPDGEGVTETPYDVHVEPFGLGWTFSLGPSLLIFDNPLFKGVQVRYADGRTVNFSESGGAYVPADTRVYDTLSKAGSDYLLKRKDLTEYRFNADGQLTGITDRNGNTITLSYDGDKLARAENSAGRWVTFTYTDGRVTGIDAPEGRHLAFAYTDGLLTSVTDGATNTSAYEYDGSKRLAKIVTPKGHAKLQLTYDEVGRAISQIEGEFALTSFVYDDAAQSTTMTDVYGNQTVHVYDAKHRLIESRDALDNSEFFGYNDQDQREKFVDREGREWRYTYDAQGNRKTEDGPLGWHREWEYNGLDLMTYQKDPRGNETRWFYDAKGNLERIVNPDTGESTIEVEGRGLPVKVWDFNRAKTEMAYDPATGDLLTVTDPESNVMHYTYDGLGRVATMQDFNGQPYTYAYNGNDKRTDVWGPLGYHVQYAFDPNGNLDVEIDPNGNQIDYDYDRSENLTDTWDQEGQHTHLTYDKMNHLASETDPEGRLTTYERDEVYRVRKILAPEGVTTEFGYDRVDNIIKTVDGEGRVTRDDFDALNRRIKSTANYKPGEPASVDTNVVTEWKYDLAGNIEEVIDPNGNATWLTWDELNRKEREENAEHEVTVWTYDPMGNVLSVEDPEHNVTAYEYDGNGRRILVTLPDATPNETMYRYDGNGNLVEETDAEGVVTAHRYNELNQRTATIRNYKPFMTETWTVNVTTEFTNDLAGNLKSKTDPNDNTTQYGYDKVNRLVEITDATSHTYTPFKYDRVGNPIEVRDPNGNLTKNYFDDLNRLETSIDPEGHRVDYKYDRANNRTDATDGNANLTTTVFDALNRPVKIIDPYSNPITMTYDRAGTLKSRTDPEGHTETWDHDLVYRVTGQADGAGNRWTFEYNDNGNRTLAVDPNGNDTEYRYDSLNRLIWEQNAEDGITEHAYDKLGNETLRTAPNLVKTRFDYDPLYRLSKLTRNYVEGAGEAVDTNVEFAYINDGAGNLRQEFDGNGDLTSHTYDKLNRRAETTDAELGLTSYKYDHAGNLTELANPRRYATKFEYYGDNLLKKVTDARQGETGYQYDGAHNRTHTTDAEGMVKLETYDALNRLSAVTLNYKPGEAPDSDTNVKTQYAYYDDGLLRTVTNPRQYPTEHKWDAAHRLTDVIDAQNGVTHTDYDKMDHPLAVTDAEQHTTHYEYDRIYRLLVETDPEGHAQAFGYDPVGNPIRYTNARSYATVTTFDPLNRPVEVLDARQGLLTNTWDAMGNLLTQTDQNEHTDTFTYDRLDRVRTEQDAEGYITEHVYDPNGNEITLIDGNGNPTAQEYDELDRLVKVTNAEDEPLWYRYDKVGNRTTMTEADSVVTKYDYNGVYRLARVTLNYKPMMVPGVDVNVPYNYAYDPNGNVTEITDPNTHRTQFIHDSLDRLHREINALNHTWTYTYDAVGNLETRLDANNVLTAYSYYADDLLKQTTYPGGAPITREYDPNHNLVKMTDAIGTSTWAFDELDRMTIAVDALGRTLGYSYDAAGNETALTYPDRRTVTNTYYKNDWLKTVTDPQAGVTSYRRDGVGLATVTTNANETVAEMRYDKANRLVSLVNRQTTGAKKTISAFAYELDDVGQRVKIDAEYGWRNPPKVSTKYTYDPLRRLVKAEDNEGAWSTWRFDAAGNRKEFATNDDELSPKPFDALSESYTHDDADELLTVLSDTSYPNARTIRPVNVAQALAAFRHEVAAQAGKHISQAAAASLLTLADDTIAKLYANPALSQSATATAITALRNQVKAHRASGAIDSDGIANSLLVKLDKADQANQNRTGEVKATNLGYDRNGNRTALQWPGPQGPQTQGTDYAFNYEDLLTLILDYQISGGKRVVRSETAMRFDGLDRRLVKTYDPKQGAGGIKRTEYTFDGLDAVAEYAMWNGQYSNYYRGDLGRMIQMQNFPSEQPYSYHHDGLGSMSALTKFQGQSVHTYRYEAYGRVKPDNGNWTDPHNGFTYTGQEWDEETNLLHFHAREYDPARGVWLQQDPFSGNLPDPVTLHRYMYARNSPTQYIDPDGRFPVLIAVVAVLVGGFTFAAAAQPAFAPAPDDQPRNIRELESEWKAWQNEESTLDKLTGYKRINRAVSTLENPNSSTGQKLTAGSSIVLDTAKNTAIVYGACYAAGSTLKTLLPKVAPPASIACRDGDCTNEAQSIWRLNPWERGVQAEQIVGRSPELVQNFPVIDKFSNGVATSIKSIDLTASSYQNTSTLTRTVQGYVETLARWQGAPWGGTSIQSYQITAREVILVVPPSASPSQLTVLQQLQSWASGLGVTLKMVTIP